MLYVNGGALCNDMGEILIKYWLNSFVNYKFLFFFDNLAESKKTQT